MDDPESQSCNETDNRDDEKDPESQSCNETDDRDGEDEPCCSICLKTFGTIMDTHRRHRRGTAWLDCPTHSISHYHTDPEGLVVISACSHEFHYDCLLQWLTKKDKRPYCCQHMWDLATYADSAKKKT